MKPSNSFLRLLTWLCISSLTLLLGCQQQNKSNTITIATASNMQYVTQHIADQFEKKNNITCEVITSSSGKLMAQIKEGAPYDIFLSADLKYPSQLHKLNLTTQAPKIYAAGKLVLWSSDPQANVSLESVSDSNIDHIALANPTTAPYGKASMSVLRELPDFKTIEPKLVYGESISQTNQFILSKAADLGFTAMAVVKSAQLKTTGKWIEIPDSLYESIDQAAVIIKRDQENISEITMFYDYLFSAESRKVLKDFGYSVSE